MEQISQVSLRPSRRDGFTLVELLVVIGIIGMLVALLLPAVMSAQEQARQTQCAKQMKDLATANLAYAMKKGYFPGWNNGTALDTWVEAILPYLDMQQLARSKDYETAPNKSDYVDPIFYCPSNPPEGTSLSLSYAANAGMTDNGGAEPDSTDLQSSIVSNRWTALFHDRSASDGVSIGLDDVLDGKRSTLLLAETTNFGDWNIADEATTGFWFHPDPAAGAMDLNNVQNTNSAPCSFHQEGFNVAYCDGHTDFYFYESLDPALVSTPSDVTTDQKNNYIKFRAKMTPAGSYYNVGANNVEYDELLP